jgi:hypothetical protein
MESTAQSRLAASALAVALVARRAAATNAAELTRQKP